VRIDWAIPCRYAEVNNGLATIAGGGIDTFWPPNIPSPIGLVMVVRLVGTEGSGSHEFTNEVLGPDMSPVTGKQVAQFDATPNPNAAPGWEQQLLIAVVVQFNAPVAGPYTISMTVDGHSHATSIRVLEGPPPQGSAA
jgi:hypothetical protein